MIHKTISVSSSRVIYRVHHTWKYGVGPVDGGKNLSQQMEVLPILQVSIRVTDVWYGKIDEIVDPLPSNVWLVVVGFKAQEPKSSSVK